MEILVEPMVALIAMRDASGVGPAANLRDGVALMLLAVVIQTSPLFRKLWLPHLHLRLANMPPTKTQP